MATPGNDTNATVSATTAPGNATNATMSTTPAPAGSDTAASTTPRVPTTPTTVPTTPAPTSAPVSSAAVPPNATTVATAAPTTPEGGLPLNESTAGPALSTPPSAAVTESIVLVLSGDFAALDTAAKANLSAAVAARLIGHSAGALTQADILTTVVEEGSIVVTVVFRPTVSKSAVNATNTAFVASVAAGSETFTVDGVG